MPGYPLERLLTVRHYRENAAARQVRARTQDIDLATATLARAEADLDAYRDWRLTREEALFQEVRNREIRLGELDDLKQEILLLRRKQELLEKELREAKGALETAREALVRTQAAWKVAVQGTSKIREHRKRFIATRKKEIEGWLEKEMEEYMVKKRSGETDDEDFK